MSDAAPLRAEALSLAYDDRLVVSDLDVAVPDRRITVIVGANACRPRLPPETHTSLTANPSEVPPCP